ncbi:ferrochelatase [Rhizosphaericola mali]|uniref:Ferrochelatase n=1 Tax=Rhizosphaericola mali TaxID=2545455 RepID=A0A5P2G721_9BACT|nr:ferrochelatase [Rhizosphaericola mali]QES89570.1 ferrochelatase [Rhizosphaericola mali]
MAKKGLILMNLGSPASTKVSDVRKYLREFLMDEKVLDLPYLGRFMLVNCIIAPFRAPKSAEAYRSIWTKDGSPLITLTKDLKAALDGMVPESIEIVMRYGHPSPEEAYNNLLKNNPDLEEVTLFPLYPHYAMSSYETAVDYMVKKYKEGNYPFKLKNIPAYFDNEFYINALANTIKPYLNQDYDKILFSYHGVPERHIHKGHAEFNPELPANTICSGECPLTFKCYRAQVRKTTKLVVEKLGIPEGKWEQTFQSRLGRDPWLQPYTAERLETLPKEGVKKLLVVSPAFVSDCLETLEEIGIQGRESFMHAGGESFEAIPCLNVSPDWIQAMVQIKETAESI